MVRKFNKATCVLRGLILSIPSRILPSGPFIYTGHKFIHIVSPPSLFGGHFRILSWQQSMLFVPEDKSNEYITAVHV